MSKDKLEALEGLDLRVQDGLSTSDQIRATLSARARIQADLGLPENALADSIRAYLNADGRAELAELLAELLARFRETPPNFFASSAQSVSAVATPGSPNVPVVPDHALSARLAEALRVYARDVLLSKQPGDDTNMVEIVECSIYLFSQSETGLKQARGVEIADDDASLAWVRAHRGAARTLYYWMLLTNGSSAGDKVFGEAERDFMAAKRRSEVPYVWSIRFRAYLHALRAQQGDFALACTLLEGVMEADSHTQSSVNRSLSMLYSYQAAASSSQADVGRDAARAGVKAGAAAVEQDPEDYVAAYFTAANWWWLAICEPDDAKRSTHERAQRAAIEIARIRSLNAISLALATLAGLQLMERLTPCSISELKDKSPIDAEAADQVVALLKSFQDMFPPDLETRLIFRRDPVWTVIKKHVPSVYAQFAETLNYDKLEKHFAAPVSTRKA